VLLLSFTHTTLAQDIVITGRVYKDETQKPVPFANVYTGFNRNIGTTTDENGKYRLTVPPGTDSIVVSSLGYEKIAKAVGNNIKQRIDFALGEGSLNLDEVVVKPGVDPAKELFRNTVDQKGVNDIQRHSFYKCEAYNKIEFDLGHLTEKFMNRWYLKPFSFVFDDIDSTAEEPFLPVFLTETLSEVYFQNPPGNKREKIQASRVSGFENESLTQFLGTLYQDINVYDNWISLADVDFVSPLHDNGLFYYKYNLVDSAFIEGRWSYCLSFKPRKKWENSFVGRVWIDEETRGVTKVDMELADFSQINFVTGFEVEQDYTFREDSIWLLDQEYFRVDFVRFTEPLVGFKALAKNSPNPIGKKTTTYRKYKLNDPEAMDESAEGPSDNVALDEDSLMVNDESYWHDVRHVPLNRNQKAIYETADSLRNMPLVNTLGDVFITIFTGHYPLGPIGIGNIYSLYNVNEIEGQRFSFGLKTTNDLSTRLLAKTYAAYGLEDERFKYGLDFLYLFDKRPRHSIAVTFRNDITTGSNIDENFGSRGFFSDVVFRRTDEDGEQIPLKLMFLREGRIEYFKEWDVGFSIRSGLVNRQMDPYFHFNYLTDGSDLAPDTTISSLTSSELTITGRFAYQEKYLSGEFNRISAGTKYPVVSLQYSLGVKGILGSDFNYHKLELTVDDNLNIKPLGKTFYTLTAGKQFGRVPYLLMEIPQGNDGYFLNYYGFNMMNQYEFAADQYAMLFADHHFEGFFFQKIPLIRELNFRTVVSFRALIGGMTDENKAANKPNLEGNAPDDAIVQVKSPSRIPYLEVGAGIENILRIFRVDAVWRLTKKLENQSNFGIRLGMRVSF